MAVLVREEVELALTHVKMALYARRASDAAAMQAEFGDKIPWLYHIFASAHLLNTLFLVDRLKDAPMGGYLYRVLSRNGLSYLLEPIRCILEEQVGVTTFGDVIRLNRNKLMVHGDLGLESLPDEVRTLPLDTEAMRRWEVLMEEFIGELEELQRGLIKALEGA